jgi:2-polyprenyl-3-methyl-5-hydroxy-6-metoxy-1,4-benzoquinol methylase
MAAAHDQTVYFDELAELFERFAADTDFIFRDWVEAHVPRHGARAVDLGCGSGRFVDLLADRYDQVLAVDISAREIELAKAARPRPNITYQVRSLLDLDPDRDGRFDLVFSVNTIHHLRDHDRVLPHVKSLVAGGGQAVLMDIVDPNGRWGSRDWQIQEAFRDAEDSYRNRSRDHNVAADVLRLRLHPVWLEQATKDVPLTRPEFHAAYSAVFPGAEFTDDLHQVMAAMHWSSPA